MDSLNQNASQSNIFAEHGERENIRAAVGPNNFLVRCVAGVEIVEQRKRLSFLYRRIGLGKVYADNRDVRRSTTAAAAGNGKGHTVRVMAIIRIDGDCNCSGADNGDQSGRINSRDRRVVAGPCNSLNIGIRRVNLGQEFPGLTGRQIAHCRRKKIHSAYTISWIDTR